MLTIVISSSSAFLSVVVVSFSSPSIFWYWKKSVRGLCHSGVSCGNVRFPPLFFLSFKNDMFKNMISVQYWIFSLCCSTLLDWRGKVNKTKQNKTKKGKVISIPNKLSSTVRHKTGSMSNLITARRIHCFATSTLLNPPHPFITPCHDPKLFNFLTSGSYTSVMRWRQNFTTSKSDAMDHRKLSVFTNMTRSKIRKFVAWKFVYYRIE